MLGAIAGDVIGSVYERQRTKAKDFPLFSPGSRFTDDSVLTCAVADRLLHGGDYVQVFHEWFHAYPNAGYGGTFIRWALLRQDQPYGSWGNGSAMRVSPVGWLTTSLDEAVAEAKASAEVTHDHPEGIRGAQAVAACIHLARSGHDKQAIRTHVEREFAYRLDERLDDIRQVYRFDVSCQGSVPGGSTTRSSGSWACFVTGSLRRCERPPRQACSQTHRWRPRPSIVSSTTSPAARNSGGFIPMPTPGGVPVITTSPASSVRNCER